MQSGEPEYPIFPTSVPLAPQFVPLASHFGTVSLPAGYRALPTLVPQDPRLAADSLVQYGAHALALMEEREWRQLEQQWPNRC